MANLLTILRMILSVLAIEFLFTGKPDLAITSVFITLFVIILDGLDGYVARSLNESSKFGSVFDILGDRVVENLYWIAFAVIGWVGVWVPMVVVTRGILTDGLRSIALSQGYTAFGSSTMMENKICKFLTASRFSRAVYGVAKTLVFLMLIIANIPNIEYFNGMTVDSYLKYASIQPYLSLTADILVYITVAMCLIRGIPVLIESKRFIKNDNEQV
jgi:CDP-diacylglycerol--glycerol-3-phosphate 3-phosphatidyltransferase